MKNIAILFFLSFSVTALSQFGIAAKFENNSYDTWDNYDFSTASNPLEQGSFFSSDLTFGINYWFRLKNKRVEFLPELNYTLKNSVNSSSNVLNGFVLDQQRYGFKFNTHLYPLDFEGDCNCPTFSKDSQFLKKGLFIIISPGIEYLTHSVEYDNSASGENQSNIGLNLGVGVGVDIGLSNLVTISPFIQYNLYPSLNSAFLDDIKNNTCPECTSPDASNGSNRQIQLGLRFSFRPDYK